MKKALLVISTILVLNGCGGGGGGGGYNPPSSPPVIFVILSPSSQIAVDSGETVQFTATVENDSNAKGVTWSCSAAGSAGAGCGTFTNATTTAATYTAPASISTNMTVSVKATSVADATKSGSATVQVSPLPRITSTSLAGAIVNANYSATLQASGGVAPLTWQMAGGALPPGLSLSGSGAITGTPTEAGNFNFSVQVADSSAAQYGGPATAQAQLGIAVATALTITTNSLPAGALGAAYNCQASASGGTTPYAWRIKAGSLPSGLTLQASTGAISGSPTAPGSVTFTLAVSDSSPTPQTATQILTLAIAAGGPLVITTASLPDATPNANYVGTIQTTGGVAPLVWTVASGTLPSGLSLSGSGVITGTPTVPGCYTFTVQVADSSTAQQGGSKTVHAQFSLTVVTPVDIVTGSLPAGAIGVAYVAKVGASGGTPPYNWSLASGTLPPGLSLTPASGAISGTPTAQGNFSFTLAVRDSSPTPQTKTQVLTLRIDLDVSLAIATAALADASPNTNYRATLQASGGVAPFTWSLVQGSLPTGLALAGSGNIAGDPTVPGAYSFTVQVTDSSTPQQGGQQSAQAQLSLTVVTEVEIYTNSLYDGAAGVAYLDQISASGGTPPYTWSAAPGSLPPGLNLQPSSGAISGSPAAPGNFAFTVVARDSSPTPQLAAKALTIAIGPPEPLVITTSALLNGTANVPYSAKVAVTGGTPPYRWNIVAGALPSTLALNSTTGVLAGTPQYAGAAGFTVQVADSSSVPQSQIQTLNITVNGGAPPCTNSGNEALLAGSYAFILSGFNDVGFITVVGSFTADGTGRVTAGEADANGVLGVQHGSIVVSGSSYSVGPDHRGCITLATPFGTLTSHVALGSVSANVAATGSIIEWDSPNSSSYIAAGQLLRQDSQSFANGLTGSYVFRAIGWDPGAQGGRDVCVGAVSFNSNTLAGMEQDCNDSGNISSFAIPGVAGTYANFDANGRGTAIIARAEGNSNLTIYEVSSSQLLVVNSDASPFASGEWDRQSVPSGGGGFTQASLNGNMVFFLNGLSLAGSALDASMETATADGESSLAITFYQDRMGAMQVSSTMTCSYVVDSAGRVTLSDTSDTCGTNAPVLYLAGVNQGFILSVAPGVDTGTIETQSPGPFSNASLAGAFLGGTDQVAIQSAQTEVAAVTLDGNGSASGMTDASSPNMQQAGASFLANSYAVHADGTFTGNSSGQSVAGVVISNSKFVMFSPLTQSTSLPTLLVMQK